MRAYAINIWGNGPHKCNAWITGQKLHSIDPSAHRVAYTQDRHNLQLSNLWNMTLFKTNVSNKHLWLTLSKSNLWSLEKYSFIVFMDLDIVLNATIKDVRYLWSFAYKKLHNDTIIAPLSSSKCVNSGLLILRPNIHVYEKLQHLIYDRATIKTIHCPAEETDQYYINLAFPNFIRFPAALGYSTSRSICHSSPRLNRKNTKFMHFFDRFMPWYTPCQTCINNGGFCSKNISICKTHQSFQQLFWKDYTTLTHLCQLPQNSINFSCIHI
jgi:hypothetical protein